MGLLIPTAATRKLIDLLNISFYGPNAGLLSLRNKAGLLPGQTPTALGRKIRNKNWARGELARGLDLLPSDPDANQARRLVNRWMHLLTRLPDSVFAPLKDTLGDALTNMSVVRVSFDHVELENPGDPDDNDNDNLVPRVVVFDVPLPDPAAGGASLGILRHVTLFTQRVPRNVN